jgi:Arc/MetJ-type ribon-helix-helix transcriptional regulator
MARASINVRFSDRDREEIEKFAGKGKPYPTLSAFVERAVQHWLDHENGRIVEGIAATGDEVRRGAIDDLIEDKLKAIVAQWARLAPENENREK